MPNHCENILSIQTNQPELFFEAFIGKTEDSGEDFLDFQKIVPRPADQESNWYEWNIENWGTKWNSYDCTVEQNGEFITITFCTAWSPPKMFDVLYTKLYELDSEARMAHHYVEEGVGFEGYAVYANGVTVAENMVDIVIPRQDDFISGNILEWY